MTATALARSRPWAAPALVAAIGAACSIALITLRLTNSADSLVGNPPGGFATDPLSAFALTAAAVIATIASSHLSHLSRLTTPAGLNDSTPAPNHRAAAYARALAISLLAYLALSVWAVWAATRADPTAPLAVALWNIAWIPSLVLSQLLPSASVRLTSARPWEHTVVIVTTSLAMLAGLLLTSSTDPFTGVQTIAPENWSSTLRPIGDTATLLGLLALLLLPLRLGRAATTSAQPIRARLGVAAVATAAAPLTVVFCLLLAIARDPGEVDPSVGSVAFVVAVASCSGFAAACSLISSRLAVPATSLLLVLRIVALATGALIAVALGTLLASPAMPWGAGVTAVAVGGITIVCIVGFWMLAARLHKSLTAGLVAGNAPPGKAPAGNGPPGDSPPGDGPPGNAAPDDTGAGRSTATPPAHRIQTPDADIDGLAKTDPVTGSPHPEPMTRRAPAPAPTPAPALGLTTREGEVLAALADGASNAGIAAQLVVSERTVDAHLRSIFAKLNLEQESATNRRVRASRIWLDRSS